MEDAILTEGEIDSIIPPISLSPCWHCRRSLKDRKAGSTACSLSCSRSVVCASSAGCASISSTAAALFTLAPVSAAIGAFNDDGSGGIQTCCTTPTHQTSMHD